MTRGHGGNHLCCLREVLKIIIKINGAWEETLYRIMGKTQIIRIINFFLDLFLYFVAAATNGIKKESGDDFIAKQRELARSAHTTSAVSKVLI